MLKKTNTNQQKTSQWFAYAENEISTKKTGIFSAHDKLGANVDLKWEKIDPHSPEFAQMVKELIPVVVQAYVPVETKFAQERPDSVPNDWFLKSLAPFIKSDTHKIDWGNIQLKVNDILTNFFENSFIKSLSTDAIHVFVVAKEPKTETILGLIHFQITDKPEEDGVITIPVFGIIPSAQNRGLGKLLMSSIFKILPKTKKIYLATRATNEQAINAYKAWGFTPAPNLHPDWAYLEYLPNESSILQKTADSLTVKS